MQINVSQQLKASIGSTRKYEVSEIVDIAGGDSMVKGEVGLIRTDRGILAKGALCAEVELTCGRCLSSFGCPLTLNIEEEYFPITDVVSGASLSLPEESGCFTIDEHHVIDLTEAIRQYALLATPMKPLCRGNCAGLCPNCGRNLNQGPCDCLPQETDPRWSELRKLTLASDAVVNEQKGME
ncbi:hypothetical protein ES705_06748 [subsurface metagenome]